MRRKVIQIAESTQLISLPRKWAVRYQVKKGDELNIEEQGSTLIVSTQNEIATKKITLDVRGQKTFKRRMIALAYIKGYDEVDVLYDTPEYIKSIQLLLQEFTGYDIVRQDKNSCTIRQISKPTPDEFTNVFNRLFLITSDTLKTIIEALKENDLEQLQGVQYRDTNINKYVNFCKRIINKGNYPITEQPSGIYLILTLLELVGDEHKKLSKNISDNKKFEKPVIRLLEQMSVFFESLTKSFKSKSKDIGLENASLYEELQNQIEIAKKQSKTDSHIYEIISHILNIMIELQETILGEVL